MKMKRGERKTRATVKWRADLTRRRAELEKCTARMARDGELAERLRAEIAEIERMGILNIVQSANLTPDELETFLAQRRLPDDALTTNESPLPTGSAGNEETEAAMRGFIQTDLTMEE